MKNLIGTTIHQYQILVKIRETGTRILYKAYDARTHQHVGLEVLKIHCVDQPALLNLLKEQAKKNAKLTNPNIALMIDSGTTKCEFSVATGSRSMRKYISPSLKP